jgi:hypothetical protein
MIKGRACAYPCRKYAQMEKIKTKDEGEEKNYKWYTRENWK